MALVKCPDCNSECSDMSPACPKCGRPLGGQKSFITKDIGFGGVIYTLMLIGGVVAAFQGHLAGWVFAAAGAILLFVRLRIWSGVERK